MAEKNDLFPEDEDRDFQIEEKSEDKSGEDDEIIDLLDEIDEDVVELTDEIDSGQEETEEEIIDLTDSADTGEAAAEEDIVELEAELEEAAKEITRKWADLLDDLTTEELHPRRTDVDVRLVALAWLPSWLITYNDGVRSREATIAAYLAPEG